MKRMTHRLLALSVILGGLAAAVHPAPACTGIRLTAADGTVIYARTMESALDFQSNLVILPRGKAYVGTLMAHTAGLPWTAKYVVVGPNVFGMPYIADGLNEKGLAVGHFVFTSFAQYQPAEPEQAQRSIDSCEVGTYLLGTCTTVPEAVHALRAVRVIAAGSTAAQRAMNSYHYFVHDAQGRCAVLEYVDGRLNVHENPLGVITNAPSFDWHLTNLRNYIHLDVNNAPAERLSGVEFTGIGQGTGLLGLPGDFTPPSRFIRAVTFTHAAFPSGTAQQCVEKAFHILNQFDMPAGAIRGQERGKMTYELTQWTTAADMQHRRYYFHTFQSRRIRVVDFQKIDLEATAVKTIPMRIGEVFDDVTLQAK